MLSLLFRRSRIAKYFILVISLLLLALVLIQFLGDLHTQIFADSDQAYQSCDLREKNASWEKKHEPLGSQNLSQVLQILETTPNLWGYRGQRQRQDKTRNDTVASRIRAQQAWVTQLAATDFIKNVKRKKILIYLDSEYPFTENRLKCPYAPSFEDKCDIVLVKDTTDLLKNQPPESYYRDLELDAVMEIRNGYWGRDLYHSEPTLPPGIQQIYYVSESPCHTRSVRMGRANSYLASYWRGADVPVPYREFVRKNVSKSWNNSRHGSMGFVTRSKDTRHLATALISNCQNVKNDRMGYISALNKIISVHVYGACGKKTADTNFCYKTGGNCSQLQNLGYRYKFYLAFENCNCEDYVTEKFFVNALKFNMVPVVMGGRRENYASAAPPHSFIHVDDFKSPKELAEYLQLLDRDDELYQKYMNWRDAGWELSTLPLEDLFCRTCGLLYYADFKPPPPYQSCFTRWKDLNKCLPKNVWNWPV